MQSLSFWGTCCSLAATHLLYHIFGSLSSLFSKFFEELFPNLSYSELLSAVPLGQLTSFSIIPHFQKFVKRFFKFSLKFLSPILRFLLSPPRSATPVRLGSELVYYTTFSVPCQVFFQNFFWTFTRPRSPQTASDCSFFSKMRAFRAFGVCPPPFSFIIIARFIAFVKHKNLPDSGWILYKNTERNISI